MKKIAGGFAIAIILSSILGCSKNNNPGLPTCDKIVLVDKELYTNTITNNYIIADATIKSDCLEIKAGASGCNGKSWVLELVDSEVVAESEPPQRYLKLSLTNNELCTAVFSKTVSFDITPLRISGSHKIRLWIMGLDKSLIYEY